MKNLSKKGLSMSQASSISNLCNQRALEIENQLAFINNCSKEIVYEGKTLVAQQPRPMPTNVVDLVMEKGRLHATQGFLMENINEKDKLLKEKQKERFQTKLEAPKYPELKRAEILPLIKEDWGWAQLSNDDMAKYIDAEAQASHIGKFIHKDSMLDRLRKELPTIKTLEWMTTPGDKAKAYPMEVKIHHEATSLLSLHEELASAHRKYEQVVNYFKAQVKNSVTEENARISKVNADAQAVVSKENAVLMGDYNTALKAYHDDVLKEEQDFEVARQNKVKEIAALRIDIHPTFQPLIDEFLTKLEDK